MKLEGVVLGADRGKDLSRLRSASSFKLQSQQILSRGHSLKIILRCRSQVSESHRFAELLHATLKPVIRSCTVYVAIRRNKREDSDQLCLSQRYVQ